MPLESTRGIRNEALDYGVRKYAISLKAGGNHVERL
jgi:hypothetical protein